MDVSASSSPLGINVQVTERGLPLSLRLDTRQLRLSADQLAHDILLTCQLQAQRAQVARRRDLVARGVDGTVIDALRLSTEDQLLLTRQQVECRVAEATPRSWMKPV
jgi:hypothetical protein